MFKAPYDIQSNWDKVCYIRPIIDPIEDGYGNQIPQYGEPIKMRFNYQPVTSDAEEAQLKAYGITKIGTVKALVDYKLLDYIKNADLAYLYGVNPNEEKYVGENANYRVITFIPQNTKILVYFERLTKKEGGR